MTEIKLRQTLSNGYGSYSYGPSVLKIDTEFKYIIYYDNVKIPLIFISHTRFGNSNVDINTACRDVETHTIYRAEQSDLVIIRRFNNNNKTYEFVRIDFLNIKFKV